MRSVPAAMVAVATAFAVVLGFGFWIHRITDAIPDTLFGCIAGAAIAAIACGLGCWMLGISPWKHMPLRIRRSRATPAGHIGRSAAQNAYDEDPSALAACVHLQPIEHAMRTTGVPVRLLIPSGYSPVVMAACRVNETQLRRVFDLPESIYYAERYQPERSEWDNPRADIICAECLESDTSRSGIQVLHPDECREDTPWFPAVRGGSSK